MDALPIGIEPSWPYYGSPAYQIVATPAYEVLDGVPTRLAAKVAAHNVLLYVNHPHDRPTFARLK